MLGTTVYLRESLCDNNEDNLHIELRLLKCVVLQEDGNINTVFLSRPNIKSTLFGMSTMLVFLFGRGRVAYTRPADTVYTVATATCPFYCRHTNKELLFQKTDLDSLTPEHARFRLQWRKVRKVWIDTKNLKSLRLTFAELDSTRLK